MADVARDAAATLTLLREATSAAEEVNARHDMYGQVAMTVADELNTSIAARMEELRVREREIADMEQRIATKRARLAAEVTLDSLLDAYAGRLASITAERDAAVADAGRSRCRALDVEATLGAERAAHAAEIQRLRLQMKSGAYVAASADSDAAPLWRQRMPGKTAVSC
jgi:hypothetical protein